MSSHGQEFAQLAQDLGWQERSAIRIRAKFFQWAAAVGCGVIETQNPLAASTVIEPMPDVLAVTPRERTIWIPPQGVVDEVVDGSSRAKMTQQLKTQIEQAIHTNETVNFSNQPHDVTTEVLNGFVYTREDTEPRDIRVVYADGSEGLAFPVSCLPRQSDARLCQLRSFPPLRIALISMRHLELDPVVDMAWYRNREASQSRTLSEADRFCYEYSMKQFAELMALCQKRGGAQLHVYHTGFEPAVVAFYRAFLHTMLKERGAPPQHTHPPVLLSWRRSV